MQTSTVFNFLSENNLLVPFLHENKVLEELTKEDLLVVVEKLLNPTYVTQSQVKVVEEQQQVVEEPQEPLQQRAVVNNVQRKKTIKLSVQDVYDKLLHEGVEVTSKNVINTIAVYLDLVIVKKYRQKPIYRPTMYGSTLGISQRSQYAVWYTLEAYDMIKDVLLGSVRK